MVMEDVGSLVTEKGETELQTVPDCCDFNVQALGDEEYMLTGGSSATCSVFPLTEGMRTSVETKNNKVVQLEPNESKMVKVGDVVGFFGAKLEASTGRVTAARMIYTCPPEESLPKVETGPQKFTLTGSTAFKNAFDNSSEGWFVFARFPNQIGDEEFEFVRVGEYRGEEQMYCYNSMKNLTGVFLNRGATCEFTT